MPSGVLSSDPFVVFDSFVVTSESRRSVKQMKAHHVQGGTVDEEQLPA